MSDSNEIRRVNIERNNAYMRELGLGNSLWQLGVNEEENTSSVQNDQQANKRRRTIVTNGGSESSNKRSSRLLRNANNETSSSYKCESCNKSFGSNHGLNVHIARKKCSGNANYMPAWYVDLQESEIQQMFTTQDCNAAGQECEITQNIFEEEYKGADDSHSERLEHASAQPELNVLQPDLDVTNLDLDMEESPIKSFSDLQHKLCRKLYGEDYIECQNYGQMILAVQQHYQGHEMQRVLKEQCAFNFCAEFGLSRLAGNKLLSLIREFSPAVPVSKSLRSAEKRIRKDVSMFNKITKINVPWLKEWKMNELKNLPSVNIYVRNVFEVISHMLIDPEIMFVWHEHIRLRYHRAVDRGQNHVYSDVMTSNWALESEKIVLTKDADGFLMPLIFYTDGVQVSSSVHNKITPVVISLGNFSDTLLQKDIAKRVIAYLPNFKCYSKDMMISHLMAKLRISCNKAKKEISKFELLVERTLYKYLVKQINYAWNKGVQYFVLGRGLLKFYPCLAFFCGDDPCQHRISGIQESNTRHGCVYCLYPTLKGVVYDPLIHIPRNPTELKVLCTTAEEFYVSCNGGNGVRMPTIAQKNIIKMLQNQNVHPHSNPFHFVAMGHDNHIYKANPPDLLHLFCAGLMKSLTQWILTIILEINAKDEGRIARFDGRIHNFPYVTPMPHLNWSIFKGGIMQFARKSKKEKQLASGSFGGFRSSAFISALFQIYHGIGFNDDILPNNYLFNDPKKGIALDLKNVRFKVQAAIETLLDVYFDCKRKEWDPETLPNFQSKLITMGLNLSLVWELKQAILNPNSSSPTSSNKMRNLHKNLHLPMYIENYGSLIHMDTCTFESYHKVATTGIWQRTSKRHNALFHEMIEGIAVFDYTRMITNVQNIVNNGLQFRNMVNPTADVEGVSFQRIMNTSKFQFMIFHDNSDFEVDHNDQLNYWETVSKQHCINSPLKFREFLFLHNVGNVITETYPTIQWNRSFTFRYNTFIIQGISYLSDEESQMGKGTIYATAKYNKSDQLDASTTRPRYDYVFVQYEDNYALARVLLIFTVEERFNHEGPGVTGQGQKLFLIIQLLIQCKNVNSLNTKLGDLYEWASLNGTYSYDIVPVQTVLRPAFVIPIFRKGYNLLSPSHLDRFVALDRKFFDRSGWDMTNNATTVFHNTADQIMFLKSNQTVAHGLIDVNTMRDTSSATSSVNPYNGNELRGGEMEASDNDGEYSSSYSDEDS